LKHLTSTDAAKDRARSGREGGATARARRQVVITGMGLYTAMARGVEDFFTALKEGRTGVSEIVGMPIARQKRLAAQIKDVPLDRPLRSTLFAREAISQALAQGQLSERGARVGLSLATVCGDSLDLERRYADFMKREELADEALRRAILAFPSHAVADSLARAFGISGLRSVNTNACASGNIAIGRAVSALRCGKLVAAVVCGTEQFRPLGYWGADRAGILGSALRPFHVRRDGTVLGDGAAALLLEERSHAEARGATILAELAGHGLSCSDNPHEIIPPMDGGGVARCIEEALRDAGVSADEVDYINAHATGTVNIEIAECRGLRKAFGERAGQIPVNATKSFSSHLSAASAVLEVIATVLAIDRGFVHPNHGLDEPDETLGVRLVGERGLELAPRCSVSVAMGAGGANSAVVVRPPGGAGVTARPSGEAPGAELWLTGAGPVSVLGLGLDAFHSGLLRARREPPPPASLGGVLHTGWVSLDALRGELPRFEPYEAYNRAAQLGLVAVVLAIRQAGLDASLVTSRRFGLIVGTWLGGISTWTDLMCEAYESSPRHITPSISLLHGAHLCVTLVSRELGVRGQTVTLTSGVTAGLSGITYAAELLRSNELDAVVVCGVDILDRMVARAYGLLGCAALAGAPREASGAPRHGAVLGEGAAAFVLERAESVLARGGRGLARLSGASESQGLVGPGHFDEDALRDAMLQAQAGHAGNRVIFSCSSGLAGLERAEARAMQRLGERSSAAELLVTSVPSVLGQAGAAGPMLSLAAAIGSMKRGLIPAGGGATTPPTERVTHVIAEPRALPLAARLLVPAANPGGAAACLSCEAIGGPVSS
jgi:3-oxoacyl-[acyl-carrier-protein] synthase II